MFPSSDNRTVTMDRLQADSVPLGIGTGYVHVKNTPWVVVFDEVLDLVFGTPLFVMGLN